MVLTAWGRGEQWRGCVRMKMGRGYYRVAADVRQQLRGSTNSLEKQRTSANTNVYPVLFSEQFKGCNVCPSIIQRVFQKVAYVCVVQRTSVYYLQRVRTVVPLQVRLHQKYERTSAKPQCTFGPKVQIAPLMSLMTQSPNHSTNYAIKAQLIIWVTIKTHLPTC